MKPREPLNKYRNEIHRASEHSILVQRFPRLGFLAYCRTMTVLLWIFVGSVGCESEPATGPSHGMWRLGSVLGEISESFAGGSDARSSYARSSYARSSYARAEVIREFRFPADHGSHDRFRSEWWYLASEPVPREALNDET